MRSFLVVCFLLLPMACDSGPRDHPIVGQWQIQPGPLREFARMTFRPDGVFWLNFGKDIISEVYGTYKIDGPLITIQYTTDTGDPDCLLPGIYSFTVQDDNLSFLFVTDPCTMRRGNHILYSWQRIAYKFH